MTDIITVILFLACGLHGFLRGIRRSLFLLIRTLFGLLCVILLTRPLELQFLKMSGAGEYPDAPAVAVLILEDQFRGAFIAACIPLMVFTAVVLLSGLFGKLIKKQSGDLRRFQGFLTGLVSGAVLTVLLTVQLTRLPWPPAAGMLQGSLIFSGIGRLAPGLIPVLAGGY